MTREQRLVALRSDLVRVARACGVPEGHAPSYPQYRQHGRRDPVTVMRWVGGLKRDRWNQPRLTWCQTVRTLGLEPTPRNRTAKPSEIAADLRRVAASTREPRTMPSPRLYRKVGRHSPQTVVKRLAPEDPCWANAAFAAGLEPIRRRPKPYQRRQVAA